MQMLLEKRNSVVVKVVRGVPLTSIECNGGVGKPDKERETVARSLPALSQTWLAHLAKYYPGGKSSLPRLGNASIWASPSTAQTVNTRSHVTTVDINRLPCTEYLFLSH